MADELWGVGQWVDADGVRRSWPISQDEMNRDMGSVSRRVGELGIGGGQQVLICSMLSEAGHFWPLTIGVMLNGGQLSLADATSGEAVRVAMFTRLMEYHAVLGITPELLDGLDELGHEYAAVFSNVAILGARPGAYERLVAAGLHPTRFALVGPALAIADAPGATARVDDAEWILGTEAGHATITNRLPRATKFDQTATAVPSDFLQLKGLYAGE